MSLPARALRPLVSRAYAFKRRHRIGERFLARHPTLSRALMALLRPFKSRSIVDVHSHVLEVDAADYLGLTINRVYEPELTRFFERSVRSGQTAIDLGAHIGYFTLLFAQLVGPEGCVVAFEPDDENFEILKRNVQANGYANVALRRQAVADRSGRTLLYRSPVNSGDHRLVDDGAREAVEVEVVALDEVLPQLRGVVQWIKLDVQGAELAALRGMRSLIDSCPELTIVTEYWPRALAEFGEEPSDLFALLRPLGFDINELLADGTLRATSAEDVFARVTVEDGTYVSVVFSKPAVELSPAALVTDSPVAP